MRLLIGWAFDTYINLRYCIAEAVKQTHYWAISRAAKRWLEKVDDALDSWEDDE